MWTSAFGGIECGCLLSDDGGHHGPAFSSLDIKVTGIRCAGSNPALERRQMNVNNTQAYLARH